MFCMFSDYRIEFCSFQFQFLAIVQQMEQKIQNDKLCFVDDRNLNRGIYLYESLNFFFHVSTADYIKFRLRNYSINPGLVFGGALFKSESDV